MTSLPTEMITEILVRLPVKTLIRFLCVQKSWYSIIKNHEFIKLHLNKTLISNSETYFIFFNRSIIYMADYNPEDISKPLAFSKLHHPLEPDEFKFIGSCNGILCLFDYSEYSIFLYNPLTNSHREVPVKFFRYYNRPIFGFGYSSVTDEYKVFYVCRMMGEDELSKAEVFSLKSNCWKSVEYVGDFHHYQHVYNNYNPSVYLNDAVYYIASEDMYEYIAKFDLRTDTLTLLQVEFLDFDDTFEMIMELSELDGCLCMLVNYFHENPWFTRNILSRVCPTVRADLWMMKECGWVRLFSICDPGGIGIDIHVSPVVLSKDGSKILLGDEGYVIGWYELDSGSFETITTFVQPIMQSKHTALRYFSGSLVSLMEDKL